MFEPYRISVIVPIYNVEKYLDRCVKTIVNQTYQNLEIILVDDGSPDRCPEMCNTWAEKDSRITVIHKENGGLSDARNAGVAVATGEYIGFVDSDDWIAPEMYERLYAAMQRDSSDIAACSVEMVWEDNSPTKMLTQEINCVLDRLDAQAELLSERKLKQPVWYKLYRRSIIKDILFEKGKYHEDVFWSYRAIGAANKVSIIDYVGYFYWQRVGSIMGEGYSLKRLDALEAHCKRYEYFRSHSPELESKALTAIWKDCIFHGQMALTYLPKDKWDPFFSQLILVRQNYPIDYSALSQEKITHKIWIIGSMISLKAICRIKNLLNVGK